MTLHADNETQDDPLRRLSCPTSKVTAIGERPAARAEPDPSQRTTQTEAALDIVMAHPAKDVVQPGETIGVGGMARVRRAVQRSMGRVVAVKSLLPDTRADSSELSLMREAWLTASLEHPNIVPVYDVFFDPEDGPSIMLKYLQGMPWSIVIDDPVLVEERFKSDDLLLFNIEILMQLCRAIHFAHNRRIVHRDLKPDNVMIGDFGEVYILDWGIAMSLDEDPSGRLPLAREAAGSVGTPAYMSPEMLDGDIANIDARTDVYLLGAVLYEIVTGDAPHAHDNQVDIALSIKRSRPVFPNDVAQPLQDIVARAMAPQRDDRYPSAEALRLDLAHFLRTRDSTAILDNASARYRELSAMLNRDDAPLQHLFEVFGECRARVQEALRAWPGNERARELSAELIHSMVEHHLKLNDPGSARALLAEHPAPDPELVARIEAALARQEQERQALAQLRQQHDPVIGQGVRRAAMASMGVLWTVSPIAINYVDPTQTPAVINYGVPAALLLLAMGVWYRARDTLTKTAINRRFLVGMLVGFSAHMVHILSVHLAGHPYKSELAMGMVSFGAVMGVLAHTAERRLWPLVGLYWAGALLGAAYRDESPFVLAGCNLVLTLYMLAIWSPANGSESEGGESEGGDQAATS